MYPYEYTLTLKYLYRDYFEARGTWTRRVYRYLGLFGSTNLLILRASAEPEDNLTWRCILAAPGPVSEPYGLQ